ncbi:hypothetical protein SRHO_G00043210 [Serrasalmus rhombeus]
MMTGGHACKCERAPFRSVRALLDRSSVERRLLVSFSHFFVSGGLGSLVELSQTERECHHICVLTYC